MTVCADLCSASPACSHAASISIHQTVVTSKHRSASQCSTPHSPALSTLRASPTQTSNYTQQMTNISVWWRHAHARRPHPWRRPMPWRTPIHARRRTPHARRTWGPRHTPHGRPHHARRRPTHVARRTTAYWRPHQASDGQCRAATATHAWCLQSRHVVRHLLL